MASLSLLKLQAVRSGDPVRCCRSLRCDGEDLRHARPRGSHACRGRRRRKWHRPPPGGCDARRRLLRTPVHRLAEAHADTLARIAPERNPDAGTMSIEAQGVPFPLALLRSLGGLAPIPRPPRLPRYSTNAPRTPLLNSPKRCSPFLVLPDDCPALSGELCCSRQRGNPTSTVVMRGAE
jgi:hypothetical protein